MERRYAVAAGAVFIVCVVGALSLTGTRVSGQQTPVPTPGTGIVKVTGEVSVANRPAVEIANRPVVESRQMGRWTVGLEESATVQWKPPSFLQAGRRYAFVWSTGAGGRAEYVVGKIRQDGWVRVTETSGERRTLWVNPAMAMSIEELD
jgi:hypothetical protein